MQMNNTARLWIIAMHRTMNPPGRGVNIFAIIIGGLARIEQQQVTGFHPGKMHAVGIHQELLTIIRHGKGEMIGNPLMHRFAGYPAKHRCQITSRLIQINNYF